MCFSIKSSFILGSVLITMGIIARIRVQKQLRMHLLATIPILFGIQQYAEGFVWLSLSTEFFASYGFIARTLFLSFAIIIWPVVSGLALYLIEPNRKHKQILLIPISIGCIIALYGIYPIFMQPTQATIVDHSILYIFYEPPFYLYSVYSICYLISTIAPLFISTVTGMRQAAVALSLAGLFAFLFKKATFGSIWCFFAAFLSLLILLLLPRNARQKA